MTGKKKILYSLLVLVLLASTFLAGCGKDETTSGSQTVTLYVGGTFALTGAYAEDTAAVLAGFEDYVKYVNETKKLAPWRSETFPSNVTLELVWRDDELKPDKALSIYDELKAKGLLVYRVSGSQTALPLMDLLNEDKIGATSMVAGPYLLTPPKTIFTNYPLYTDELAAIADWFIANWKGTGMPRVAYLTADSAPGRSIDTPEMEQYLKDAGFEFVGKQFVPMVPTSPPTTQLAWLKENNVDLALGWMINPGSQPTIKEAVRLGMGPDLDYKITFGFAAPSHLAVLAPALGTLGDGVVVAGSYPPLTHTDVPGIAFAEELQVKYRPNDRVTHIMYLHGIVEAMVQVEALRLASLAVPAADLTAQDVLEQGFQKIKNLSLGDMSPPLTFGPGDIEGPDEVRLDQVQNGEVVVLDTYPTKGVYAK
ncbi:MAG: ABC transporter substrate-binding protein [Dehalococcoidales bacterium]|nr:ABC transporter substrate-binding protein [Dehalococcoidales bacterium]